LLESTGSFGHLDKSERLEHSRKRRLFVQDCSRNKRAQVNGDQVIVAGLIATELSNQLTAPRDSRDELCFILFDEKLQVDAES